MTNHNWYGNVTFQISMNKVAYKFGTKFHYIDRQEFSTHTSTRIILLDDSTNPSQSVYENQGLSVMSHILHGAPVMREWGSWRYVSKCTSAYGTVPHEVEIGIKASPENCKWLYENCTITGNNHSECNQGVLGSFAPHKCHRFNTFKNACPYQLTKEEADKKLESINDLETVIML